MKVLKDMIVIIAAIVFAVITTGFYFLAIYFKTTKDPQDKWHDAWR